jgi:hypothetical protein
MEEPNRINQLSMTVTSNRQTPKDEFGDVLLSAVDSAVKTGSGVLSAIPAVPIVSAAVQSVSGVLSTQASKPGVSSVSGVVPINKGAPNYAAGAMGGAGDRPVMTDPSLREMQAMSDYYMRMQNEVQKESREYNAVTNIIKVRHESAKAAINNIR